VDVDDQAGPTVDLVYFFTSKIAVDVLGGLPFEHDINIDGAKSATAKHLLPVVTLQYHFLPEARLQPYIGAGLNYTWFFDEHLDGSDSNLQIKNSFGLAAQVGLDWKIDDHWLAGVDVRWIDVDADVSLDGAALGTVHIDPFVYSLTVGYRF
jgi:outer membrane protein